MKVLFGILIVVVFLIIYGSLYPWLFVARELPASPLYILLHSWNSSVLDRRFISDIAINIAIYMPLGMAGFLALRRYRSRVLPILAPFALGTLLSAAIEMTQLYTPHRTCSAVDLVDNMLGSALGVVAGLLFVRVTDVPVSLHGRIRFRSRSAVALLFCWVCSLLFPLFPVMWLFVLRAKLSAFVHAPVISPVFILLRASEWFTAGRLLQAAGFRCPTLWLALATLLVPAGFMIMNHDPMPSDFIGAALGVSLFFFLGSAKNADQAAAAGLMFALILSGLTPFHMSAQSQGFDWIPFVGMLTTEWQSGIQVLLRKSFEYGAAIWLLHQAGLRLRYATGVVALLLGAIEVAQTHLPQHVAEITDPALAVLLGLALGALDGRAVDAATAVRATILRRT